MSEKQCAHPGCDESARILKEYEDMVSPYRKLRQRIYTLRRHGLGPYLPLPQGLILDQIRKILPEKFQDSDVTVLEMALRQEGYVDYPRDTSQPGSLKTWYKTNKAQPLISV